MFINLHSVEFQNFIILQFLMENQEGNTARLIISVGKCWKLIMMNYRQITKENMLITQYLTIIYIYFYS